MDNQAREQRVAEPPDGYEPAIARWVWALEDARRRTKQSLGDTSNELIDWDPPEGGNTIGTVLYHLVAIEMSYIYEDMLQAGWAEELESLLPYDIRDEQGLLSAVRGEGLETHLQRLDASRELTLNALRRMTLDDFLRPRRLEQYDITPEWICHHLMQHEAEHRGQIGELRARAMGAARS